MNSDGRWFVRTAGLINRRPVRFTTRDEALAWAKAQNLTWFTLYHESENRAGAGTYEDFGEGDVH